MSSGLKNVTWKLLKVVWSRGYRLPICPCDPAAWPHRDFLDPQSRDFSCVLIRGWIEKGVRRSVNILTHIEQSRESQMKEGEKVFFPDLQNVRSNIATPIFTSTSRTTRFHIHHDQRKLSPVLHVVYRNWRSRYWIDSNDRRKKKKKPIPADDGLIQILVVPTLLTVWWFTSGQSDRKLCKIDSQSHVRSKFFKLHVFRLILWSWVFRSF